MQTASVLHLFCAAALLISLVNAQSANRHPADDDPRIQKQPPFHWGTPPPNHRVKLDFIPIKVLASVRHERTSKHVPRDEALADASTAEEIILAKRLKESITTKKLGEVYSEQGYEDQNYDHGHFEKQGKFDEKFQNHDKAEHRAPQHNYDGAESSVFGQKEPHFNYDGAASSVSTDLSPLQTIIKPKSKKVVRGATDGAPTEAPVDSQKYPFYLTAPKNSPQSMPRISNLWEWMRNKIQVNVNVSNNSIEWNSHCFIFFWKCRRQDEQTQRQQQTAPAAAAPVAAAVADNLVLTHYSYPAAADQYISPNTARPAVHWINPAQYPQHPQYPLLHHQRR